MAAPAQAGGIEFLVKCPSRPSQADFRLRVPAAATVREVKLLLQASYPGNPAPATVTVSKCRSGMGWRADGEQAEGTCNSAALPQAVACATAAATAAAAARWLARPLV